MKRRSRLAVLLALITFVPRGVLISSDKPDAQSNSNGSQKYTAFDQEAGTWDTKTSIWPNGNLATPTVFKGVERIHVSPNGLIMERMCDVAGVDDQLSGNGLMVRYDPKQKRYFGEWPEKKGDDSFRSLEGAYDEKTRTLTMVYFAPADKQGFRRPIEERVIEFKDANTKRFTIRLLQPVGNGKYDRFTVFEMIARRRTM